MKKHRNGNGTTTGVEPDCRPCAVPAFCRSNYYTGKLLTERDFSGEQQYHTDKLRLHQMALHGWGLVCGLTVHPHPYCPHLRIVVEAGMGIDDCGREVRVLRDVELPLPQPDQKAKPKQPCPPEPDETDKEQGSEGYEQGDERQGYEQRPPYGEDDHEDGDDHDHEHDHGHHHDHDHEHGHGHDHDHGHRGRDLYVCVRYCETPVEYTPAPFDDCGCNSEGQHPNRICESYEFKIFEGEPDFLEDVRHGCRCGDENCRDIYQRVLKKCAKPGCLHWLPLAVIHCPKPGEPVTEEMIDNWSERPLLPSTRMLDHLIQCILKRLPPAPLTNIAEVNWRHADSLSCREFLHDYVGRGDKKGSGFMITFSDTVRPEGIDNDSFQALVVHTPSNPAEPRRSEIAPASITVAPDNRSCRLHLEPAYAHQHLDGRNFDVFIRLRCDFVVDERGHAVDGNLLARYHDGHYIVDTPTGNGIPGGLFESWFQVQSGASKRQ